MSKKKRSFISVVLIIVISFSCGFLFNHFTYGGFGVSILNYDQMQLITNVAKIINSNAIQEQNGDNLLDYILLGMAASLNDPYANYLSPDDVEDYTNSIQGVIEGGIGCELVISDGTPTIASVYTGLSANSVGLKAGDVILSVDGQSVEKLSAAEISALVKGEPETTVNITVLRNSKTLSFNPKRTNGQRQMTEYCFVEGTKLLYIKIASFRGNAAEYFDKAITFAKENSAEGLIIDLRENGGGELVLFEQMAELITPKGEIFYAMTRQGEKIESYSVDDEYYDVPISVIINGSSASASEAFAGALRDLADAKIVGTKSFGKGIMQKTFTLKNGGLFKLTVGKYYLPSGECIHETGITPEYEVGLSEELTQKFWLRNNSNDLQLKKAIEVLTE